MESVPREEELRGIQRAKQQQRIALAVGIAVIFSLVLVLRWHVHTPEGQVTLWVRYGPGLLVAAVAMALVVALLTQRCVRENSTGAAVIALLALVSVACGAFALSAQSARAVDEARHAPQYWVPVAEFSGRPSWVTAGGHAKREYVGRARTGTALLRIQVSLSPIREGDTGYDPAFAESPPHVAVWLTRDGTESKNSDGLDYPDCEVDGGSMSGELWGLEVITDLEVITRNPFRSWHYPDVDYWGTVDFEVSRPPGQYRVGVVATYSRWNVVVFEQPVRQLPH